MLRRKLLLILLCVTGLLMALAVAALWSLQDVFADLNHINVKAGTIVDRTGMLSRELSRIEVELHELQAGRRRHLDVLIEAVELARDISREMAAHYVVNEAPILPTLRDLQARWDDFMPNVGALATSQDPQLAAHHNREAIATAAALRGDILEISRYVQQHMQVEQAALTRRFRWLLSGVAIGFLLVINCSILLLLRTAAMILRPVDKLVAASRMLAAEHFEHRVAVGQNDEFDELAAAYNRLAEQLEENEQRKVETLHQVARTLNHELNNAMTIIDLQLTLLQRHASHGGADLEKYLRQIHDNLMRMVRVVQTLTQVRRVVLTDYANGEKMLDLARSVEQLPPVAAAAGESPGS